MSRGRTGSAPHIWRFRGPNGGRSKHLNFLRSDLGTPWNYAFPSFCRLPCFPYLACFSFTVNPIFFLGLLSTVNSWSRVLISLAPFVLPSLLRGRHGKTWGRPWNYAFLLLIGDVVWFLGYLADCSFALQNPDALIQLRLVDYRLVCPLPLENW